jgi:hypothetical protein
MLRKIILLIGKMKRMARIEILPQRGRERGDWFIVHFFPLFPGLARIKAPTKKQQLIKSLGS